MCCLLPSTLSQETTPINHQNLERKNMKRSLVFIFLVAGKGLMAQTQNQPVNEAPQGTSANVPLPRPFNGSGNPTPVKFNYTRSWSPKIPWKNGVLFPSLPLLYNLSTTYTNGLGMPIQAITRGLVKDLVTPIDNRKIKDKPSYLPYPATAGQINFQMNPYAAQKVYYQSAYPLEGDNAYSRTKEISTGGQHYVESFLPGRALTGSNRGVRLSKEVNGAGIHKFGLRTFWTQKYPEYKGDYPAGQLMVKKTEGQHGALVVEYYNKSGQLLCKQVEAGENGNSNIVSTYYVYDDLGRIVWLITPKAIEILKAANWSPPTSDIAVFDGLCHHYTYNKIGQIIQKRSPDRGVDYTVYDKKNRPVLRQNQKQAAAGEWAFEVFNERGRGVFGGTISSSQSRQQWQEMIDMAVPPAAGTLQQYLVNGFSGTYPNHISNCRIDYYNYFDTYTTDPTFTAPRNFSESYANYYSTYITAVRPKAYMHVPGLLTGSKVRILNGIGLNSWILKQYFYEQKGKLVQEHVLNPFNNANWDIYTFQYNFDGSINTSIVDHYAIPGSGKLKTLMVTRDTETDVATGRLTETKVKLDHSPEMLISSNYYDEMGRLFHKRLANGIEVQNFTYNIRGQLTGINPAHINSNFEPYISFGETISYDYGFEKPRFDGAISGITWRGAGGAAKKRAYGYHYDRSGRMLGADFNEASGSIWSKDLHDYSVSNITYDANGNMLTMKQKGVKNGVIDMDDLNYHYIPNSNKLDRIEDNIADNGLNDFVNRNAGTTDYSYDPHGNLTRDLNKEITNIEYSDLDLPLAVSTSSKGSIENVYTATGELVQKTITPDTGAAIVYKYWGPFVYRNNMLEHVLHDEGRARFNPINLNYNYDFFIKDHLGNVRSVVTYEGGSIQEFLATHEYASANIEQMIFDGLDRRSFKPGGNGDDVTAAELNGSDPEKSIGTSLILKVMAGDKFTAEVSAYYNSDGNTPDGEGYDGQKLANSVLGLLSGGLSDMGNEVGGVGFLEQMIGGDGFVNTFHSIKEGMTDPSRPRAYLNYVVFDEEMNIVPEQSGAIQVTQNNDANWADLKVPGEITIANNGYLLTFISNETQGMSVFMDNVLLTFKRGLLLEEQHYYPHGLTISGGTNNPLANRYLYQGKQLQMEAGLDLYDFHARQYDPQIGRFWGVDPADQFPSGYTGMGNDPASMVDPTGMMASGGQIVQVNNIGLQDRFNPYTDGSFTIPGNIFGMLQRDEFAAYMLSLTISNLGGGGGGIGDQGSSESPDTDVYTTAGAYVGTVTGDGLPNQIHYSDKDPKLLSNIIEYLNNLSPEERMAKVSVLRKLSIAYIGKEAAEKLKSMAMTAAKIGDFGQEVPYYATISKSRELDFTFFKADKNSTSNITYLGTAAEEYNKSGKDIDKTFGTGHPHIEFWFRERIGGTPIKDWTAESALSHYAKPTPAVNSYTRYDYNNVYSRDVPLFINSPLGITLYNTSMWDNPTPNFRVYQYSWFKNR
jgi:RHS repeat-associated protein